MKKNIKMGNLIVLAILIMVLNRMLKKNKNENKKFSGLEIVLTVIMFLIGNKKKS